MIPQHLQPFFWDIDPNGFDPRAHPDYTIARLLELGDTEAIRWLRGTFSEEEIRQVLLRERRLSRKSATFWALVYHVGFEQIAALGETATA